MARIPDSVLENFRLAAEQGKLVSLKSPQYESENDDPEDLKLKDEQNATWVNLWRIAVEDKSVKLPNYELNTKYYSSKKKG